MRVNAIESKKKILESKLLEHRSNIVFTKDDLIGLQGLYSELLDCRHELNMIKTAYELFTKDKDESNDKDK